MKSPVFSKICLIYLIANLKTKGFILLDTQFVNPHLKKLGAIEIPRKKYLKMLGNALKKNTNFIIAEVCPPLGKKQNHSLFSLIIIILS